jgi:hypothetical protein
MGYVIAPQFIRDNLSGLASVFLQYPLKEAFSGFAIPTLLQKYIHHFTILVNGSP